MDAEARRICIPSPPRRIVAATAAIVVIGVALTPAVAAARVAAVAAARVATVAAPTAIAAAATTATGSGTDSLESAASRASDIGRTIAFSLIGLALAVAAVLLVFRRDFKEAIGVLAIGVIAVLLASPVGLTVLQDTVSALFGSS